MNNPKVWAVAVLMVILLAECGGGGVDERGDGKKERQEQVQERRAR